MAPKKSQTNGTSKAKSGVGAKAKPKDVEAQGGTETPEIEGGKGSNKKRKAGDQSSNAPNKSARRSERSAPPASLSEQDQIKILNYLLSPASLEQTRPKDEKKDLESRGGDDKIRTYSASTFTPLEELISAMILSRPIGRTCGEFLCRSIVCRSLSRAQTLMLI